MFSLSRHLRNSFLSGIFAAIPIAATAFVVWYVDSNTRFISQRLLNLDAPFLGVLIALAAIYLLGFAINTLLGKFLLRALDRVLSHIPIIKPLYTTWKQIALTPGEGVYSRVVLFSDENGQFALLGFTSGAPTTPGGDTLCVFVPNAPNPTSGQLYFVKSRHCTFPAISSEDAFKVILSNGSYIPPGAF